MKDSSVGAVVREDNVEAEICGQGREKRVYVKDRGQVVVLCCFCLFFYEGDLNCKEYISKH